MTSLRRFLLARDSSSTSRVSWCEDKSKRSKWPPMNSVPSSLTLMTRPSLSLQSISLTSVTCLLDLMIVKSTVEPREWPDFMARYPSGMMDCLGMKGQNYYLVLLSSGCWLHATKSLTAFWGRYASYITSLYPKSFKVDCTAFKAQAAAVEMITVGFKYPYTTWPLKLPAIAYRG